VIYCVVPEALADDLFDKLTRYYDDDPNVTVIVDRRKSSRRERGSSGGGSRERRDRRRARVPGELPPLATEPDGTLVDELSERIGLATNNVAEYRAVLRGLERARALGADEVEIVGDSELIVRQLNGAYKVKHPAMKPLHEQAMAALRGFERWRIRSVPRAQNARADALVNEALDAA
jgi:ribonuclease HI